MPQLALQDLGIFVDASTDWGIGIIIGHIIFWTVLLPTIIIVISESAAEPAVIPDPKINVLLRLGPITNGSVDTIHNFLFQPQASIKLLHTNPLLPLRHLPTQTLPFVPRSQLASASTNGIRSFLAEPKRQNQRSGPKKILEWAQKAKQSSFAENSETKYGAGILRFMEFCDQNDIDEELRMPADATLIAAFVGCHLGKKFPVAQSRIGYLDYVLGISRLELPGTVT
ncbi:hypothetical protein VNI00_006336 [Paramarasmius palmivorus]|uniref:Uncharacterized protein n=1 Tax=Paramarasmius palmivorus TaxID=297713 RepID=A0AAW0D4P4_9AGAR